MRNKNQIQFFFEFILTLMLFFFIGCVAAPKGNHLDGSETLTNQPDMNSTIHWTDLPKPAKKQLVAIAGFENRSTYSADKLWDTSGQLLAANMIRAGYFRVVEWERMKTLFDWDALSNVDLIKSPDNMKKAQRILLCEYFISGAITYFDVSRQNYVSAMSKNKTYETTIRVDLLLQNAKTGEYLATGAGEHTVKQVFKGTFSGGQTGTWSPRAADKALNLAIQKALFELISSFHLNS